MARRPNFKVTTQGVDFENNPSTSAFNTIRPDELFKASETDQVRELIYQFHPPTVQLVHMYAQNSYRFIAAVSKAIGKKPEDLLLDMYKPFEQLLDQWAASNKEKKRLPKFKLGAKKGRQESTSDSDESDESETADLPQESKKVDPPSQDESQEYQSFHDELYNFMKTEFNDDQKLSEYDAKPGFYIINWNRYLFINGGSQKNFFEEFGYIDIELPTWVNEQGSFLNLDQILVTKTKNAKFTLASNSSSSWAPLKDIVKQLFEQQERNVHTEQLINLYKYSILPEKFSKIFFGNDLTYGIGQAMQKLREAYHFTKKNDTLFAEFVENEKWRDLFVSLVACIINLQQKVTAFNAPQGTIRMLRTDVQAFVSKFHDYPGFANVVASRYSYNI